MKIKKILNIVGNILFYTILICLLSISFIMIKSVKEGKQPTIMGNKFFTVLTGSMEPAIMTGDLIISKETPPKEIQVGDIITFGSSNSDNITTHRVKEVINEEGKIKYITQGDANNVEDPNPVPEEMLIGKVVKCIPKLGSIMSWMKSNLKIIIGSIFAITALGIIGNCLISRLKVIDEEENKKDEENKEEEKNDLDE